MWLQTAGWHCRKTGNRGLPRLKSSAVQFFGILKSDECDEQTDADADCRFQADRNGVEDRLTDVGQRKYNKDDTFCKKSAVRAACQLYPYPRTTV